MSVALPYPLNAGEQILKECSGTHLRTTPTGLGYNLAIGHCWLTNQRIILRPQRGMKAGPVRIRFGPVAYPISRIINAEIIPMKVQWSKRNVIRLEFDNGGKEYFDIHADGNEWLETLNQAKAVAPELPYETPPAIKSGVEGAASRSYKFVLMLAAGLAACGLLSCIATAAAGAMMGK